MDYAEAGVDIDEEAAFVEALTSRLGPVRGESVEALGGYAGILRLGDKAMALSVDGVGTKLLVAEALGRLDTVGVDCVAMNVNDVVCTGVEPVAFVDYVAVEHLDREAAEQLGEGLARGCEIADVDLVAGETATLPEVVRGIDLVGCCIGFGEGEDVVTSRAQPGDTLVALASSGIHSNGLTLARRSVEDAGVALDEELGNSTVGEALLRPTEVYAEPVLRCYREGHSRAAAHITGGGLLNLERMGPNSYRIVDPPEPHAIFDTVQDAGAVSSGEMYRTFNMGAGIVMATSTPGDVVRIAGETGHEASVIGYVEGGSGVTVEGIGEL
ncbi:MAG: Phosphoribosylformylglycinamidine cyclo-ligase [Methanonatronarchaeales archaeon]|nr:Phosphoribosylformylglycinamidine cyclo-ligase [Methanonatronarchaeales archaeon]